MEEGREPSGSAPNGVHVMPSPTGRRIVAHEASLSAAKKTMSKATLDKLERLLDKTDDDTFGDDIRDGESELLNSELLEDLDSSVMGPGLSGGSERSKEIASPKIDPRPRSVVTVSQRVADISPKNPSLASMPSPAPKPARGGEPPVVGKSPTARGASGSGEAATAELGLPPGAVKTLRKSNNIGHLGRLPEGSGTGRRRSGSLQRSVSSVQDEEAAMQRVSAALERVDATLAAMRSSTGVSAAVANSPMADATMKNETGLPSTPSGGGVRPPLSTGKGSRGSSPSRPQSSTKSSRKGANGAFRYASPTRTLYNSSPLRDRSPGKRTIVDEAKELFGDDSQAIARMILETELSEKMVVDPSSHGVLLQDEYMPNGRATPETARRDLERRQALDREQQYLQHTFRDLTNPELRLRELGALDRADPRDIRFVGLERLHKADRDIEGVLSKLDPSILDAPPPQKVGTFRKSHILEATDAYVKRHASPVSSRRSLSASRGRPDSRASTPTSARSASVTKTPTSARSSSATRERSNTSGIFRAASPRNVSSRFMDVHKKTPEAESTNKSKPTPRELIEKRRAAMAARDVGLRATTPTKDKASSSLSETTKSTGSRPGSASRARPGSAGRTRLSSSSSSVSRNSPRPSTASSPSSTSVARRPSPSRTGGSSSKVSSPSPARDAKRVAPPPAPGTKEFADYQPASGNIRSPAKSPTTASTAASPNRGKRAVAASTRKSPSSKIRSATAVEEARARKVAATAAARARAAAQAQSQASTGSRVTGAKSAPSTSSGKEEKAVEDRNVPSSVNGSSPASLAPTDGVVAEVDTVAQQQEQPATGAGVEEDSGDRQLSEKNTSGVDPEAGTAAVPSSRYSMPQRQGPPSNNPFKAGQRSGKEAALKAIADAKARYSRATSNSGTAAEKESTLSESSTSQAPPPPPPPTAESLGNAASSGTDADTEVESALVDGSEPGDSSSGAVSVSVRGRLGANTDAKLKAKEMVARLKSLYKKQKTPGAGEDL